VKEWMSEQLDIWTSGHQDGLMVVLLLVVKMAIWLFRWTSGWLVIRMSRHLDSWTA
jgi:hypothetical protein